MSKAKTTKKIFSVRNVAISQVNWLHFAVFKKNMCVASNSQR